MKNMALIFITLISSTSISAATWPSSDTATWLNSQLSFSSAPNINDTKTFVKISLPEQAQTLSALSNDETLQIAEDYLLGDTHELAVFSNHLALNSFSIPCCSTQIGHSIDASNIKPSARSIQTGMTGTTISETPIIENTSTSNITTNNSELNQIALWGTNDELSDDKITLDIFGIDASITPSAVPLPAALWMFTPPLLGMLGLRHKHSKLV